MRNRRGPGVAFLTIGVVFIAIGSSGPRAFLGTGAAFLVVGFVLLMRSRGDGGPGGSRGYLAKDLEGNIWYFGTYRPGAH